MYHKVKIGQLSQTQISRLLNGHGVRISHGSNHEIELSKEQLKKYMKAHEKGKAMTLTMDPFQMQSHQHLRGSGSGGSMSGCGVGRRNKFNKWVDTLGARDVINAGMHKAASTISGGKINRLKKAQRWEGFANATLRDGIDTAGKAARVYYDSTDPMAQMGFGLKKRGRPRRGGALYPAGIP